jgi:hypothetical protein
LVGGEEVNVSRRRRVTTVLRDGKWRVVTAAPSAAVVLRPLHDLIYDRISKEDWLLRGSALPESFSNFHCRADEVFVSGDYQSATDNLRVEVAEEILGTILRSCTHVPLSVQRVAFGSLRSLLEVDGGETFVQARGQLMGSYLSFPLLCLQNYLAFKYLVRRDVPVKINGDDIVFRCYPAEFKVWADGLGELGLTLSAGKTMVRRRFFSLNSTYFQARPHRAVKFVPVVRASLFWKPIEDAMSLTGRMNVVAQGFGPQRAFDLRVGLLRRFASKLSCTQRSLTRGLGMDLSEREITAAGFAARGRFYLSFPRESRPPSKACVSGALPRGWVRVPSFFSEKDDPGFGLALARHCWRTATQQLSSDDYWEVVRRGTCKYQTQDLERGRKLLGVRSCTCRLTCACSHAVIPLPLREMRRWWFGGRLPVMPAVPKKRVWAFLGLR